VEEEAPCHASRKVIYKDFFPYIKRMGMWIWACLDKIVAYRKIQDERELRIRSLEKKMKKLEGKKK